MMRFLAIGALALWAGQAAALDLAFPMTCTLGDTCYIQQFFDHDAGPKWRDYTCGTLAYDGHDGTDIAVPTRAAMAAGVQVLAAAPGTVKGVRDGVADFVPSEANKECGNGVVVDHGGGWETQYCHLKQGSVLVGVGQPVDTGTVLGMVGQSGLAEFPHMHFSVRKNGVEVDPFAPNSSAACGAIAGDDLWQDTPIYTPGGILGAGFSTEVPQFDAIKSGLASPATLPQTAPALVMWVYLFGGQAGDAILFEITGPEGKIITERAVVDRNRALFFHAVGRKMRAAGWAAGEYTGTARLIRRGAILDSAAVTVGIAP